MYKLSTPVSWVGEENEIKYNKNNKGMSTWKFKKKLDTTFKSTNTPNCIETVIINLILYF